MAINKNMTIVDILGVDPGIADILQSSGMHCLGCVMAHGENLGQACAVHGIDAEDMEKRINEYLSSQSA